MTKMAWGKLFTETTTASSSSSITSTVFPSSVFNTSLHHLLILPAGNNVSGVVRVGKTTIDNSPTYSQRYMFNGNGNNRTDVDQYQMKLGYDGNEQFMVVYSCNIATSEKLFIGRVVERVASPKRKEGVGKWVNTASQFDIYSQTQWSNGRLFADGSNLTILGSDAGEGATSNGKVQDGAVFYEKDTNKEYILNNGSWSEL